MIAQGVQEKGVARGGGQGAGRGGVTNGKRGRRHGNALPAADQPARFNFEIHLWEAVVSWWLWSLRESAASHLFGLCCQMYFYNCQM